MHRNFEGSVSGRRNSTASTVSTRSSRSVSSSLCQYHHGNSSSRRTSRSSSSRESSRSGRSDEQSVGSWTRDDNRCHNEIRTKKRQTYNSEDVFDVMSRGHARADCDNTAVSEAVKSAMTGEDEEEQTDTDEAADEKDTADEDENDTADEATTVSDEATHDE